MACEHWWNTVEELGYGYVSVCENCGKRESAEHSQECFDRMLRDKLPCNCGAAEEFEKHELGGAPKGAKKLRVLDLFCGRWGWSKAFAERGWECVGVDLVHSPETQPERSAFIQDDILNISAAWVKSCGFDFVCASSPCEQFSVHGMPHFHPNPPSPELGLRLFEHTRSICEESGVPHVMENVRAAQKFVGQAVHHCGPFYLWGSAVPPLLPRGIKKGFQTGGSIIQKLKRIDRKALTDCRRQNDLSWSSSGSAKRKAFTALAATIPPELANCVAEYAERILETRSGVGSQGPHKI